MTLNISLIPFTNEHVALTFEWVKDPDFQRLFLMRSEPTWEGHKKYFERVLNDNTQRVYAILAENEHVGNCGLKNLSEIKKEGELWIYVGDPLMRGKGIGVSAARLLLCKGFEVLGLEMIYAHVADFNISARRLYEKLGFIEMPLIDYLNEWNNRGCKIIRMAVWS